MKPCGADRSCNLSEEDYREAMKVESGAVFVIFLLVAALQVRPGSLFARYGHDKRVGMSMLSLVMGLANFRDNYTLHDAPGPENEAAHHIITCGTPNAGDITGPTNAFMCPFAPW